MPLSLFSLPEYFQLQLVSHQSSHLIPNTLHFSLSGPALFMSVFLLCYCMIPVVHLVWFGLVRPCYVYHSPAHLSVICTALSSAFVSWVGFSFMLLTPISVLTLSLPLPHSVLYLVSSCTAPFCMLFVVCSFTFSNNTLSSMDEFNKDMKAHDCFCFISLEILFISLLHM